MNESQSSRRVSGSTNYPSGTSSSTARIMLHASLTRMDISTQPTAGAVQYLISVTFADDEGRHLHDRDPRFRAWNEMADTFQVAPPIVTGGEVIVSAGEPR